nr:MULTISPECIES: hypothetical protein [unclassified Streptomyces]
MPGTVGDGERPGSGPRTNQGVRVRARKAGLLGQRPWGRTAGANGGRGTDTASDCFAARVHAELAEDLPDEDLGEDLADVLERYEPGTGPGADAEADEEFLETVREAQERIQRGY